MKTGKPTKPSKKRWQVPACPTSGIRRPWCEYEVTDNAIVNLVNKLDEMIYGFQPFDPILYRDIRRIGEMLEKMLTIMKMIIDKQLDD